MNGTAAGPARQERETFDLNKRQAAQWFGLRLCMGYCGLAMLLVLAAVCGFVILTTSFIQPWQSIGLRLC